MDTISDKLALVDINDLPYDPRTARVKEWLESHAAWGFCGHFKDALDDPDYDLKSILCNEHTRKTALRVPVDIEDAIWKGKVVVDDDKFGRLVKRGDPLQFLLNAWITPAASEVERQERSKQQDIQMLHQAFTSPFVGPGLTWLDEALNTYQAMYDQSKHYGKAISILQSSGMGKSRAVAELAKTRYLLSICFRDIKNPEYDPKKGWPPHDTHACRFFCEDAKSFKPKFKGEELAAAFLGALMEVVGEQLSGDTPISPEDFSKIWKVEVPDGSKVSNRELCFEKVRNAAKSKLKLKAVELEANRKGEGELKTGWFGSIYTTLMKEPAKKLVELCGNAPFIIAIDECVELNLGRISMEPQEDISLPALHRMVKACDEYNIWYIFMDTNSGVQYVLPRTGELASSFRLVKAFSPLPAFPYFAFDVMADKAQKPSTPHGALDLAYLKHFGRPVSVFILHTWRVLTKEIVQYWSTLPDHDVLRAAKLKLIGAENFDVRATSQVFAILSSRLLLELGITEAANRLAMTAVGRHMRILTGVTSAEEIMNTCAPSEPMLAIAAASLLVASPSSYKAAINLLVKELILKGLVLERGRQGELLARILLMMARDFAISPDPKTTEARSFVSANHVTTVTLDKFLTALLGDKLGVTHKPKSLHHGLLRWATKHKLNFTHFLQVNDNIHELTPEFLEYCWNRGIALTCAYNQPLFDILIVTYHGDLTQIERSKFGLLVIQVKLRIEAADRGL
ncbi:hypothetical protein C0991_003372, partial [Blastosporella zonata]